MTQKQIEASRRNGTKSRGPVSAEGRSISSQNATVNDVPAGRNATSTKNTENEPG